MNASRERLILENLGLSGYFARQFNDTPIDFDDLVQAGHMGLCEAADRFDPDRGIKFSTFASDWILKHQRALVETGVRNAAAMVDGFDPSDVPAPTNDPTEAVTTVEAHSLLDALPAEQKAAVASQFGIDRPRTTVREEAASTGVHYSTVSRRRRDALDRLRALVFAPPTFHSAA